MGGEGRRHARWDKPEAAEEKQIGERAGMGRVQWSWLWWYDCRGSFGCWGSELRSFLLRRSLSASFTLEGKEVCLNSMWSPKPRVLFWELRTILGPGVVARTD